jgi:hypothetical protein
VYSLIVTAKMKGVDPQACLADVLSSIADIPLIEWTSCRWNWTPLATTTSETMHINNAHYVTTISRLAKELSEDEDWLGHVAVEMDAEDGLI